MLMRLFTVNIQASDCRSNAFESLTAFSAEAITGLAIRTDLGDQAKFPDNISIAPDDFFLDI